jgi:hypothetical protein
MSFPTFEDFDKAPRDVFKKDFDDEKVELKIKTNGPSGLQIDSSVDFFKPKDLKSKVAFKKKFDQFSLDKIQIENKAISIETALEASPSLKIEFKGDEDKKGDLSAVYKIPAATITAEADIVHFNKCKASISSGYGPLLLGGNVSLKAEKNSKLEVQDFVLGAGYSIPKTLFVAVRAQQKLTSFEANALYTVSNDVSLAGTVTYPKNSLQFGAVYKCNPNTALKFKLDSAGKLGASAKQTIDSNATVTAAASLNVHNPSSYKFGVVASLG